MRHSLLLVGLIALILVSQRAVNGPGDSSNDSRTFLRTSSAIQSNSTVNAGFASRALLTPVAVFFPYEAAIERDTSGVNPKLRGNYLNARNDPCRFALWVCVSARVE